jgi:hypothetical protein
MEIDQHKLVYKDSVLPEYSFSVHFVPPDISRVTETGHVVIWTVYRDQA